MKEFQVENIRSLNSVELKEISGGFVPLVAYVIFGLWGLIVGAAIAATT